MKLAFSGSTCRGFKRAVNQDAFLILDAIPIVVICDGMGGHQAGEVASSEAIRTISKHLDAERHPESNLYSENTEIPLPGDAHRIIEAVRLANRRIFTLSRRRPQLKDMGTTLTAAWFGDSLIMIAHVGDGKAIRYRGGETDILTRDHNQIMVTRKGSSPRKTLTRAVGISESLSIDVWVDQLRSGDRYCFCTDGVFRILTCEQLGELVRKGFGDLPDSLENLMSVTRGEDDATIVSVAVTECVPDADIPLPLSFAIKPESLAVRRKEDMLLRKYFPCDRITIFRTLIRRMKRLFD